MRAIMPNLRHLVLSFALVVAACGGSKGGAAKLEKPVASIAKEDLKTSLEKGGWKVGQVNESSSGQNKNYTVSFEGDGKKGRAQWLSSPNEASRKGSAKSWEDKKAAVHTDGNVVLAIDMDGDTAAAKKVLDGMLGK
jgi:hypothetical protein